MKFTAKPIAILKLDSENSQKLNELVNKIYSDSKKMGLRLKGPVSLPNKKLSITLRKAPCGRGSSTFINYNKKISIKLFEIYNQRLLTYFISNLEDIEDINMHLQIAN